MPRTTRLRGRIETNLSKISLPAEVLALVADELEGDFASLRALSQVSTAWCQRARDLLYRSVYLGDPKAKSRCKALVKMFTARPSLAHATHKLTIVDNRKTLQGQGWLDTCMDLEKVLSFFTSVQVIALRAEKSVFRWGSMPSSARTALSRLLGAVHVREIELDHVQAIDIGQFARYHHLSGLIMNNVMGQGTELASSHLVPTTDIVAHNHGVSRRLTTLRIGGSGHALHNLLRNLKPPQEKDAAVSCLDFRHLEEIRVQTRGFDREMSKAWQILLETCASHVERYHIDHDSTYWMFSEDQADVELGNALLSLENFTTLFSLNIQLVCEDLLDWGFGDWIEPLQGAILRGLKELAKLPTPTPLRELKIAILHYDPFGDLHIREDLQDVLNYDRFLPQLAEVLSDEKGFPNLVNVSILFHLDGVWTPLEDWPVIKRDFVQKLKGLGPAGRNILDINCGKKE